MLKRILVWFSIISVIASAGAVNAGAPEPQEHVVGTWASSQYSISASDKSAPPLAESTFRQIIRLSIGGELLRFTFSNEYGRTDLEIKDVRIAKPTGDGKASIDVTTDIPVTFRGFAEGIVIPAGSKLSSDWIYYPADALDKIAVSVYFGEMPGVLTHHAGSRSDSFLLPGHMTASEHMEDAEVYTRWYVLSEVDVIAAPEAASVILFGDSIADGFGTDAYWGQKPDSYTRWADVLMNNLQSNPETAHLAVINMGIGANSIFGGQGPAGRQRFDRDIILQEGAGYVVIHIGVNDIGAASDTETALTRRMTDEYEKMIQKSYEAGIGVYLGTISPFGGHDYYTENREAIRQEVNEWIRGMDSDPRVLGILDFDRLLALDNDASRLDPDLTNDYLHPSVKGYAKMGEYAYSVFAEDLALAPEPEPELESEPEFETPQTEAVKEESTVEFSLNVILIPIAGVIVIGGIIAAVMLSKKRK